MPCKSHEPLHAIAIQTLGLQMRQVKQAFWVHSHCVTDADHLHAIGPEQLRELTTAREGSNLSRLRNQKSFG